MQDIVLFPFNGNAREALGVIADINARAPRWRVRGFLDDDPAKRGREFAGCAVIGGLDDLPPDPGLMYLAVPGRPEQLATRRGLLSRIREHAPLERGARIVHPRAVIGPECRLGRNCLLMAGVVLTAGVSLGDNVIVLPNTVIAHDCEIADNVIIGSSVVVSGGVRLEQDAYVGSGSRIIQERRIGARSLVGLGSVVLDDVPPDVVCAGVPARPLERRGRD